MILIINTSCGDLELVLGDNYSRITVEKQSVALPSELNNVVQNGPTFPQLALSLVRAALPALD